MQCHVGPLRSSNCVQPVSSCLFSTSQYGLYRSLDVLGDVLLDRELAHGFLGYTNMGSALVGAGLSAGAEHTDIDDFLLHVLGLSRDQPKLHMGQGSVCPRLAGVRPTISADLIWAANCRQHISPQLDKEGRSARRGNSPSSLSRLRSRLTAGGGDLASSEDIVAVQQESRPVGGVVGEIRCGVLNAVWTISRC